MNDINLHVKWRPVGRLQANYAEARQYILPGMKRQVSLVYSNASIYRLHVHRIEN